jgi:hypothetical protein
MFAGHLSELVIVVAIFLVTVGGPIALVIWLVRLGARTAAREYVRERAKQEHQSNQKP